MNLSPSIIVYSPNSKYGSPSNTTSKLLAPTTDSSKSTNPPIPSSFLATRFKPFLIATTIKQASGTFPIDVLPNTPSAFSTTALS